MPLLPAPAPASHVPSHLPEQATPPCAVQEPEQLPVQVPSHFSEAPASASHEPEQDTSSLPPSHFGIFASAVQFALPEHLAEQFAFALTDAWHCGAFAMSLKVPPAFALTVPIAE